MSPIGRTAICPGSCFLVLFVLLWTACDSGNAAPIANGEFSGVFTYTVDQQPFEEDWVFNISE